MAQISIVLDVHNRPDSFQFLCNQKPDFLSNSVIAIEHASFSKKLEPLSEDDKQRMVLLNEQTSRVLSFLHTHPCVYSIENIWEYYEAQYLMCTIEEQIKNNSEFIQFLHKTLWLRDRYIAENLIELLKKHPGKDIISFNGMMHYGIVYHLYRLMPSHLRDTNIRVVNTLRVPLKDLDSNQQPGIPYYFKSLPCELIEDLNSLSFQLDLPIKMPTKAISNDNPVIFDQFMANYESYHEKYQKNTGEKFSALLGHARDALEALLSGEETLYRSLDQQVVEMMTKIINTYENPNVLIGIELSSLAFSAPDPASNYSMHKHFQPVQPARVQTYPSQFMVKHF